MRKIIMCFILISQCQLFLANSTTDAEVILQDLYRQFGDTRIELPSIELVQSKDFVAAYFPGSNKIQIEEKAMEICQTFGDDKNAAIAFIIGHELAHAFQDHLHEDENTSFLAYDKVSTKCAHHILKKKEHEADIFGAFGAYVAGYKIHRVFPEILNKIYEQYELTDEQLVNYPSKALRNQTAEKVKNQVDSLILLFDAGTKLSLLGQHELSAQCYEKISKTYKGSEVNNNAGVNYLLEAINSLSYTIDPFIFPIEISGSDRLQKAKKTGDSKDLNAEEMSHRIKLIEKGQMLFKAVLNQDAFNPAAVNNYAISLAMMENYHEALGFLETKRNNIDFEDFPALLMTEALVQNLLGARAAAPMETLHKLSSSEDERINTLAKTNLALATGQQATGELDAPEACSYETLAFLDLSNMKNYASESSKVNNSLSYKSLNLKNKSKSQILFFNTTHGEAYLVSDQSNSLINASAANIYFQEGKISTCVTESGVKLIQLSQSKHISYLVSNVSQ